jgi:anti-sigma B factor antagonist
MDVFPSGHDQGRSIITVTGDIDLGTAEHLLVRLTALIGSAGPTGSAGRQIGLDLSGVTFIDCAGLRTLIAVHAQVRADGATTLLTAMSPAVARLLELVDVIWDPTAPAAPTAAPGPACTATHRIATAEQTAAPRCVCLAA